MNTNLKTYLSNAQELSVAPALVLGLGLVRVREHRQQREDGLQPLREPGLVPAVGGADGLPDPHAHRHPRADAQGQHGVGPRGRGHRGARAGHAQVHVVRGQPRHVLPGGLPRRLRQRRPRRQNGGEAPRQRRRVEQRDLLPLPQRQRPERQRLAPGLLVLCQQVLEFWQGVQRPDQSREHTMQRQKVDRNQIRHGHVRRAPLRHRPLLLPQGRLGLGHAHQDGVDHFVHALPERELGLGRRDRRHVLLQGHGE